jgi:G3E family GTPase
MSELYQEFVQSGGRLPVSVLTGFLGSGKTTLLSRLLRHPDMARTAVVINEFGEVGLDHLLVAQSSEDVVVMDSGCLCCTVRGDLVDTLTRLYLSRQRGEIPEFDRLVIETTGLADPAPILHTLITSPLIEARFRLDGVIVTVDAVHGMGQLDQHRESVKQAAVADRLVLTKTDLLPPEGATALAERLRRLNPAARLLVAGPEGIEPAALFDAGLFNPADKHPDVGRWLNEPAYRDDPHDHPHAHPGCGHGHCDHPDHDHHGPAAPVHDAGIGSFCLTVAAPMPWEGFSGFIEALVTAHGASLLRVKGLLNIADSEVPLVIHGVQHLFHPVAPLDRWPDGDRRSKIVFITRDLDRPTVERLLRHHLAQGGESQ